MPAVTLARVSLARGRQRILQDMSFSLGPNEFVGMLGPNGAGKTTLMQALLGLIPVAQGALSVLGATPRRGNPGIGYMPQHRQTSAGLRLRGQDFVAGVVKGHRWGLPLLDRQGRADVAWALEMVQATDLARRPLAELSGGQRQRLLLAQALIGRPRLLLLDEPLMSLDPRHQQSVVEMVKSIQTELRLTVLFSAHELNPLLGSLDRVLYLGNGRAVLGSVAQVITGPVLSQLYATEIEVVTVHGRIFVMSGGRDMERDARQTGHGHHA